MSGKMTVGWWLRYCVLLLVSLAGGCSALDPKPTPPPASADARNIAVFFDGTANDLGSGTNTSDLYQLVLAQGHIGTFYIEGVGAKGKPVGLAMAWGIGQRVRLAYAYLAEHYREGDQVYLFGFSRGADSARILASLLYHAGLPGRPLPSATPDALAELVFDAYKCGTYERNAVCASHEWGSAKRIERVNAALAIRHVDPMKPVPVRFLGLWDTVEALGWPDYEENVDVPNHRYADQLCNVEQAAHALSLDDNRARIFTPILLTRVHLLSDCGRGDTRDISDTRVRAQIKAEVSAKVEEIYFAGAHADVGGGYEGQQGRLSGVSLNWMIRKAIEAGLPLRADSHASLPRPEDPLADGNDAEGEFPNFLMYKRMYRNIDAYAEHDESVTPVVKFHHSLRKRLAQRPRSGAEYGGPDPVYQQRLRALVKDGRFESCFPANGDGLRPLSEVTCRNLIISNP
ncbi:DUF2235 domain-containing protein [Hydrogenophaga sp.]|uniref:phospholipase effector Tle1 domain-containing protein n=1 Tax=Hydrogenophaga sp. TaxID=1904254 RepID=UPI0025BFAE04|nr:DUF2235 domain-containing protein [Hydrogenophaga sp.]MBT9465516.1 DUF2235 domain-containing protein [Hydrogenophaga sp.]